MLEHRSHRVSLGSVRQGTPDSPNHATYTTAAMLSINTQYHQAFQTTLRQSCTWESPGVGNTVPATVGAGVVTAINRDNHSQGQAVARSRQPEHQRQQRAGHVQAQFSEMTSPNEQGTDATTSITSSSARVLYVKSLRTAQNTLPTPLHQTFRPAHNIITHSRPP